MQKTPLTQDKLYHRCDPKLLPYNSSKEISTSKQSIGQQRALDAIKFAINLNKTGYNLYVLGQTGAGKHLLVRDMLEQHAPLKEDLQDWCYVNNFKISHQPIAIGLPAGLGADLKQDLKELTENLSHAIPKAFEAEIYEKQIVAITHNYQVKEENALAELDKAARVMGIVFLQTEADFSFAPMLNNEIMQAEHYDALSNEEQQEIQDNIKTLQKKLQSVLQHLPKWQLESRKMIKALNHKIAKQTVAVWTQELQHKYQTYDLVIKHLTAIENDVIENVENFLPQTDHEETPQSAQEDIKTYVKRYHLNLLVYNSPNNKVPIVYETNPTLENLIGKIDSISHYGALITDFTLIKPGALHTANGGYLLLDIFKLLSQPYSWEALKRALSSREITIESPSQSSVQSTITLSPTAIPLRIKVILLGDYHHYFALCESDPEFEQLFKVVADLEDSIDRNDETQNEYAELIASLIDKHALRAFSREAMARLIEQSSRWVEDREKLSTHRGELRDLLIESDYWANENKSELVEVTHIETAIDQQQYRVSRLQSLTEESIIRDHTVINTSGSVIGQINALTIANLGKFTYGQPSRISAVARMGDGKIIDIEQESNLGGDIHTKGVLILSHFFSARYLKDKMLSFSASIVFEQSYGEIDGDSASAAELIALISAFTDIPINQSLAITGAVDQHGKILAIGGVNEKIEGFFSICQKRTLTGNQGVVIPHSNISNLMLNKAVMQAIVDEQFFIYAVEHIDEAIELLMGTKAGNRDSQAVYPEDSVNGKVEAKLDFYASRSHEHDKEHDD